MIKERFLFNFSEEEKRQLKADLIRFQMLKEKEDKYTAFKIFVSTQYLGAQVPKPYSPLDVKYLINRLSGNDTSLSQMIFDKDDSFNGDVDALKIKDALKTNDYCHIFVFHHCNLTDDGAISILEGLKNRDVSMLDLRGNKLTSKTLNFIMNALDEQQQRDNGRGWNKVLLGRVELTQKQADEMSRYPQLVFIRAIKKKQNLFQKILGVSDKIDIRGRD